MSASSDPKFESIALVLAGSSNLQFWPLSRINNPIQFQRSEASFSPFQKSVMLVDGIENLTSIYVIVSAPCINMARQQIAELRIRQRPVFIVEPVERGSLFSILAGLIMAAASNRNACFIALDANQPANDHSSFHRLLDQFSSDRIWEQHPVLCCAQVSGADSATPTMPVGKAVGHSHLFHLPTGKVTRKHWVNASPALVFLTPRLGLQIARVVIPGGLDTVNSAVQAANELNGCTWPDTNLWSTLPDAKLLDVFADSDGPALLRPVDFIAEASALPPRESDYEIIDQGHLIAVSECSDVEIITTADATLVRPRNQPFDASKIIDHLRNAVRPELHEPVTRLHEWGVETEREQGEGFAIKRITVRPGRDMVAHFHNHRTENWHVLSGTGEAVIDRKIHHLKRGATHHIPQGTVHSIANTGTVPLNVLEIQHGSFLSKSDHIEISTAPFKKFAMI